MDLASSLEIQQALRRKRTQEPAIFKEAQQPEPKEIQQVPRRQQNPDTLRVSSQTSVSRTNARAASLKEAQQANSSAVRHQKVTIDIPLADVSGTVAKVS